MGYRYVVGARALVALSRGGHETAAALRSDGWHVDLAHSGWEAAFMLGPALDNEPDEAPPDLLVISADLCGMSGLSLLAEVRALGWTCPVFVAVPPTAHQARREALALGATAIFDEPVLASSVLDAVREYQGVPTLEMPLMRPSPRPASRRFMA